MSPTSNTLPRLAYSLDEVPEIGGPSRATLYRLEKAGTIKLIRGAGRVKIAAADLHRLLGMEAGA
jgi:predicted site-specific integrase-resolvase